jgi:hypothetical protein
MRRVTASLALVLGVALAACDRSTPDSPTITTPPINAFAGTWRSIAASTPADACSSINWTIAPTGANTAAIAYTATCGGVPVAGTGSGTLNGTTLNWSTTGTAANACPFGLSGTAVPDSGTDLRVSYSGTVCGALVSGAEVLHR